MPHRLLLIDDSPLAFELVQACLQGEDIELSYALDGNAGIEMAKQLAPDVILLDVEMPAPDGFEVCRRLKLDPAFINTPIVFVSGRKQVEEKILGLELGAVDYITKPFDAAELKARVRTALRIKQLTDLLSRRAQVDAVTGLWTADYFGARLQAELKLARRTGNPVGLLLVDIDRFRPLNSEHGPWWGDHILKQVAEKLMERTRAEDVVCRLGATFALICPASTSDGLYALGHRLGADIAKLNPRLHNVETPITASFGIAVGHDRASPDGMLTAARAAILSAKQRGGNRVAEVAVAPSEDDAADRRKVADRAA